MKPEAQEIALAILGRVNERSGFVNKTKLLKLLYLADIEHYRKFGETLTGFDWIFHLFGPWSREYDALLEGLERRDAIAIEAWESTDREGARIRLHDSRDLNDVIRDTDEFYRIQHQVDTWNDRSLSELLDYVYFETEPMSGAVSGESLSFENVSRDAPTLYRREKSHTHPAALKRLKTKLQGLQRASEERRRRMAIEFRQPAFDDVYVSALADLEESESRGT